MINISNLTTTGIAGFGISNVSFSSTCNNNLTGNVPNGTNLVAQNCTLFENIGDFIVENQVDNTTIENQNTTQSSNLTTQWTLNRSQMNISNNLSIALNTVSFTGYCANNASANVPIGNNLITTNCTYVTSFGDLLTESNSSFFQNSYLQNEVNGTFNITQNLTVQNLNGAVNWTNVLVNMTNRSSWNVIGTTNTINVNGGATANFNFFRNFSQSNTVYGNRTISLVNSSVVVGNVSVFQHNISLNNTDSTVNWTNITLNYSRFLPVGIYNNVSANLIVNESINQTTRSSLLNASSNSLIEGAYTSCAAGFTLQGDGWCRRAVSFSDRTEYTYRFRVVNNNTDVKSFNVSYDIPISRMTSFGSRTTVNDQITLNSSTIGIAFADVGANFQINTSVNHR